MTFELKNESIDSSFIVKNEVAACEEEPLTSGGIITEAGITIITESGDKIIQE